MSGHDGDVIAELTADHRQVEGLFERFKALASEDHVRRREATDAFTAALVRHAVAEEEDLYPAVRGHVPGGGPMADRELAGRRKVEELLSYCGGSRWPCSSSG